MSFPGFPLFISFGTPKISFIGTFFRPTSSSVSASSEYPPVVFRAASHSRAMHRVAAKALDVDAVVAETAVEAVVVPHLPRVGARATT